MRLLIAMLLAIWALRGKWRLRDLPLIVNWVWTTPATWTTSQLVGASDMNTQIRDNLAFLLNGKALVNYRITSGTWTTTSAIFVQIDGTNLTATLDIKSGRVKVEFGGFFSVANAGVDGEIDLFIDNVDQGTIIRGVLNSNLWLNFHAYLALAVGSHTIDVRWKTNGSTLTLAGSNGGSNYPVYFAVVEL
jgi:hypothetical protein